MNGRLGEPSLPTALAEPGPGGGEVDDFGGVFGVFVGVFEGLEEKCANEVVTGALGRIIVFFIYVHGELLDAVDEAHGLAGFDGFPEPVLMVCAIPARDVMAEGVARGSLVLRFARADEGIWVAFFEIEVGDIAVGDLVVEPIADG